MNEYNDVQTVECPVCKKTDLVDAWRSNEISFACRTWVCTQCNTTCSKEIITRVERSPIRGYNLNNKQME